MPSKIPTDHKNSQADESDELSPLLPPPSQASMSTESTELKGYLLLAISCIGFALSSFLVHVAEDKFNFPTPYSLFIRGTIQSLVSIFYVVRFLPFPDTFFNLSQKQLKLLAVRGVAGALSFAFYFAALKIIPVGDAVTISFSAPVMVMILSSIFLGERMKLTDCIATATSLTGIFLVARPDFGIPSAISSHDRQVGGLYCIASAFLSSVVYVTIRSLGTGIHFMVSVFSPGLALVFLSILLGGVPGPDKFYMMKEGTLALVIASCFAFKSQCFFNRALQICRPGPGSVIRNLDVPLTYILGMLLLNESPSLLRLIGAMLVVLGAVIIGLRQIIGNLWSGFQKSR